MATNEVLLEHPKPFSPPARLGWPWFDRGFLAIELVVAGLADRVSVFSTVARLHSDRGCPAGPSEGAIPLDQLAARFRHAFCGVGSGLVAF